MKIKDICRNYSNQNLCFEEFHLHCTETLERNQVFSLEFRNIFHWLFISLV